MNEQKKVAGMFASSSSTRSVIVSPFSNMESPTWRSLDSAKIIKAFLALYNSFNGYNDKSQLNAVALHSMWDSLRLFAAEMSPKVDVKTL